MRSRIPNNTRKISFNTTDQIIKSPAPYIKKEMFDLATQGLFIPKSKPADVLSFQPPQRFSPNEIRDAAWSCYKAPIESENNLPRLLFSGYDGLDFLATFAKRFPNLIGESFENVNAFKSLQKSARVYAPLPYKHFFETNAAWTLGVIHKNLNVTALSNVEHINGAYTKELFWLFKAGYSIEKTTFVWKNDFVVELSPPSLEKALKITLQDLLDITGKNCIDTQKFFTEEKNKRVHAAINFIPENFLDKPGILPSRMPVSLFQNSMMFFSTHLLYSASSQKNVTKARVALHVR